MEMGKQIFTTTPSKMHIIFIFKIQKFFSGEEVSPSPHPTPLGASILTPSVLDATPPEKILGTAWEGGERRGRAGDRRRGRGRKGPLIFWHRAPPMLKVLKVYE
jgi:hypothetical protein